MQKKSMDPLSGCCLMVAGIFVLFLLLAMVAKSCSPHLVHAGKVRGLLAQAFTGVLFWAVVFLLVSSTREK